MNQELDRTEELLGSVGKSNNKKKLIIIVIAAAVLAAGAGVFAGIKLHSDKQIKEQLKTADALLAEGKYEKAIAAYDKVIEMDEGNAFAYEGKADSYNGLGKPKEALKNFKTSIDKDKKRKRPYVKAIQTAVVLDDDKEAEQLIEKMHENVEDTKDITLESVLMGGEPGNLSNKGLILQDGDTTYIANSEGDGSIGVVENGSKKTPILKDFKDDGRAAYITGMNLKGNDIYFISSSEIKMMHDSNYYCGKSIYKIDKSGKGKAKKLYSCDWGDPQKYYSPGENPRMIGETMFVIKDRIFFAQRGDTDIVGEYRITSVDLEGKDFRSTGESIRSTGEIASDFTSDGKSIYFIADKDGKGYLKQYDIATDNTKTLNSNLKEDIHVLGSQLIYSNNKLYLSSLGKNSGVYEYDIDSGKMNQVYKGSLSCKAIEDGIGGTILDAKINVIGGKLYFTKEVSAPGLPDDLNAEISIYCLDLDKEDANAKEVCKIRHDYSKDGMESHDMAGYMEPPVVGIDGLCIAGKTISYGLDSEMIYGNVMSHGHSFGNDNI